MLTCYDATFAAILDAAGVECLLVGDSLGMVLQGQPSTLPVTLEQMVYHTQCVARGNQTAWIIGDLPFGSYQESKEQALRTATVRFLVERGIPVCAHLGLMPQSVHALGGYRVQGHIGDEAACLKQQAQELADAGAAMLVLELIPAVLAREVTAALAEQLPELEAWATAKLAEHGWVPDYLTVRRQADLQPPQAGDALVALGAARIGATRLIENLEVV